MYTYVVVTIIVRSLCTILWTSVSKVPWYLNVWDETTTWFGTLQKSLTSIQTRMVVEQQFDNLRSQFLLSHCLYQCFCSNDRQEIESSAPWVSWDLCQAWPLLFSLSSLYVSLLAYVHLCAWILQGRVFSYLLISLQPCPSFHVQYQHPDQATRNSCGPTCSFAQCQDVLHAVALEVELFRGRYDNPWTP